MSRTHTLESAVLAHLGGADLRAAADRHDLDATELGLAVARYTAAGRAALEWSPSPWRQLDVAFADDSRAEEIACAHLLPTMARAPGQAWWFMRKPPGWRIRIAPPPARGSDLFDRVVVALERAAAVGAVASWRQVLYEEESAAFGGPDGMDLAHRLFHADSAGLSRALLTLGHRWPLDARITASLLVMNHLHRAADLDAHERADVWAKVAASRSEHRLDTASTARLTRQARIILTRDITATAPSALGLDPRWARELAGIGTDLARAAREGRLERGLRAVLALHVIFQWNRMAVPAAQQSIWSCIARNALLPDPA